MINYSSAPNGYGDAWQRYYENGISPGSFGEALLRNDVDDAYNRADHMNIELIPQHLLWLLDHMSLEAWGTPEKLRNWIAKGGALG